MARKIVVTGGAGFIGSNLCLKLVEKDFDILVIDDLSTGLESNLPVNGLEFVNLNLTNHEKLKKLLLKADCLIHLAARGSVPRSIVNPVLTNEVNTKGTINVLEVARETGAHVIFSSSSSVYGRNSNLPKEEKMWVGPINPYAASKLSAEAFVGAYSSTYGFPATIFRFFNVFGPRQRPDHPYSAVIPKWIWSAINGKAIEIHGDGRQTRDFTYVDTVVEILIDTAMKKFSFVDPINLAYGNRVSLNEVVDVITKRFPTLNFIQMESRKGDIKDSQNNPKLIKSLFPDINPVEFQIAMNKTIDWLMEYGEEIANGPVPND